MITQDHFGRDVFDDLSRSLLLYFYDNLRMITQDHFGRDVFDDLSKSLWLYFYDSLFRGVPLYH